MATSLPGPGTILTGLEVRFSEAVTFPATIEVRVEVRGRVRRITRAAFRCDMSVHVICVNNPQLLSSFSVENTETKRIVLRGEASCLLTREQLEASKQ